MVLAGAFSEHSRSRLADLVRRGSVQVDGQVETRPSARVRPGAQLRVDFPPPRPSEAVAQDLPLVRVYEDDDIVVVDKPAGMVVHPAPGHPDGTLVNALLHHVDGLSGLGTSGLLVVAKHDAAHAGLAAQFADHSAGRRYLAICLGVPRTASGRIESHLARHPRDRVRFASTPDGGRRAITHWTMRGAHAGVSLLECRLDTGRTHQIRVHLREQGWPIAGDALYRRKDRLVPGRMGAVVEAGRPLLHARWLELRHPRTGEACRFGAPCPADFLAALEAAGIPAPDQ